MTTRQLWNALSVKSRLLLGVVVLDSLGAGLVLPFTFVYLHEVLGLGVGVAGVLISVQAAAGVLATVPSGALIDTWGPRALVIAALMVFLIGDLVLGVIQTVPGAVAGLLLTGVGLGVLQPALQSLIAVVVPSPLRTRFFASYFLLFNVGIGLGGLVGGLFVSASDPGSFRAIFLIDAATFLPSLAVLVLALRDVGARIERDDQTFARPVPVSYLHVLRQPAVLMLASLELVVVSLGYGQLTSGLPALASSLSDAPDGVLGYAFAVNTLVIVVLQSVVVGRIERRPRTRVLAAAAVTWGVAWLLLGLSGLAPGSWVAAALVVIFMGVFALGETLFQPTLPTLVNDLARDDLRGRYNAVSRTANQAGTVIGPVLAGVLLGAHLATIYIAVLVVGNLVIAGAAVTRLERLLPVRVNRPARFGSE